MFTPRPGYCPLCDGPIAKEDGYCCMSCAELVMEAKQDREVSVESPEYAY